MSKQRAGAGRQQFYVGRVEGKIFFYRDLDYNVLRADLFKSRRAARKCYDDVVRVTVERLPKKVEGNGGNNAR
jgi:hypothetical protein